MKLILSIALYVFIIVGCSEKTPVKVVEKDKTADTLSVEMPPLPDTVSFCGKLIPINDFDLQERLDRELVINTYFRSSTIQYFKRANRYFDELSGILKEEGIPDDFKYLCLIESSLTQATSGAGARGFWQFMPETAKEYDLVIDEEIDERLNIEKSTRSACDFLKDANGKFNDWVLAAASYNRGVGGIQSDLKSQGVSSYFDLYLNEETSRYVFRILALKLIFESPESYGFAPETMHLYQPIPTHEVIIDGAVSDLRKWSLNHGSNFKMLKRLNPWILGSSLSSKYAPYGIALPKDE